jgi:hypothetical protein
VLEGVSKAGRRRGSSIKGGEVARRLQLRVKGVPGGMQLGRWKVRGKGLRVLLLLLLLL